MTLHFFCILVSWLLAERGCASCVTTWMRIWPVHAMWQNTNSYGVSLKTKCLRYFSRDVLTPVLTKYSCIIVYQVLLRNTDNLTEVNLLLRQYETNRKGFWVFWLWVTSKKTFCNNSAHVILNFTETILLRKTNQLIQQKLKFHVLSDVTNLVIHKIMCFTIKLFFSYALHT